MIQILWFCLTSLLTAQATRVSTRHLKRQDYNQPSYYQPGFEENDIRVQYSSGSQYPSGAQFSSGAQYSEESEYTGSQSPSVVHYPSGPAPPGEKSSYALFKKAEDDRKPVMFPSPPPPEREERREETTPTPPTQDAAPSERYISVSG